MESIVHLLIQGVCGAGGGLGAGKVFSKASLGTVGNIISGIVGGVGGGQLLSMLGVGGGGFDLMGILTSVLSSFVGGGALMGIVSLIKNLIKK